MDPPFFAPGYVRLLHRVVQMEGADVAALFADAGFTESELLQAGAQVPFANAMHFCRNALAVTPPGLGLRAGLQLQLAAHGPLGTAMQSAPDLNVAFTTFTRLLASRANFLKVELDVAGDRAVLSVRTRELGAELVPFFVESTLLTVCHALAFYTGRNDLVRTLRCDYAAPDYRDQYAAVFGIPAEFDASESALDFDARWLSLASPEADAALFADSVARCEDLISARTQKGTISRDIENFLLTNPGRLWTLGEVAPLFAMSPRTLMRRLAQESSNFQQVRDRVLQQQAQLLLRGATVEAVAMALGFADTASFRRSFKRWFGVTPSAHRAAAKRSRNT